MARPDARLAMIEAAERLVADRGLGAMSLAEVQVAAGQRNKSAATYHFGSRDGLMAAVIETRMAPVNRRRSELLEGWETSAATATIRDLVEALVQPLAAETVGRDGSRYARFLTQAMFDPSLAESIEQHLAAGSYRAVRQRLVDSLELPGEIAAARTARVVMLTIVSLATWEGRQFDLQRANTLIADLVDSCVAVLEAPVSAETAAVANTTTTSTDPPASRGR